MRRRLAAFAVVTAAIVLGSCGGIDKILEGNPIVIKLAVSADSGSLTIAQGSAKSLHVRIQPVGDVLKSAITVKPERVPAGVTVAVDSLTSDGTTTTVKMTVDVGLTAVLGPQEVRYVSQAARAADGGILIRLLVVPPAEIGVALAKPTLTIARGGGAPITAQLTRTSFPLAVKFTLDGAPAGFSATFDAAGTTTNSATASIVVASSVTPGTYNMNVRATGIGVADQLTPLTVNVTADPIQLIADVGISTAQAVSAFTDFVINRGVGVGAVTLSAENLPGGVTATFDNTTTTNPTGRITIVPAGTVPAGDYTATIRAQAAGFADATTIVSFTVLDASIALAVTPSTFEVLQGQSALVNVALTRTRFTGSVAFSVTPLPTGVSMVVQPNNTTGSTSNITFQATASAAAGTYDININATPSGLGASKVQSIPAKVTVRAVPAGANVVLDWTGCTMPLWIASQNGTTTAAWSRVLPVGSVAGFLVNAGRGGYAWYDGSGLFVRYALQSDLTAKTISMCPAAGNTGSKNITGIGVHTAAGEIWNYSLGGSNATSTTAVPTFSLFSVIDGPQDLLVMGGTLTGNRGLLRRDQNIPNGGALDPVDLTSTDGFTPLPRNMTVTIGLLAGEGLSYIYNYLTTPACVENRVAAGSSSTVQPFNGVPDASQRTDDFHEFIASATSTAGTRLMSVAFHTAANRTIVVPANPTNPVATLLSNTTYTRMSSSIGSIPSNYNGSMELRYTFGSSQTMSVAATTAYSGLANAVLAMPDFSGVSGFQPSYAIPAGAGGSWRLSLDGASVAGGKRCTEGRTTNTFVRSGTY